MDIRQHLEDKISTLFVEENDDPNYKHEASYFFERGAFHVKEAYLFLLSVGDKNLGKVAQNMPETVIKRATEISNELRALHTELEKLAKEK